MSTRGQINMCTKRTATKCDECELDEAMAKRFKVSSGWIDRSHGDGVSLCQFQATNLKQHSFLTKFVLAALPNKDSDLLEKLFHCHCSRYGFSL